MERHKAAALRWGTRRPSSMAKPKTHVTDATKNAPEGAAWTLCGLFVLREQVDTADPPCKKCLRAANKEPKSR